MSSLNQVSLVGHVGRKPTLKQTQAGGSLALFSVATNDEWLDKEGARKERTEWHRIVAWGMLAEVIGQHLEGGRQVHVQGAMRTREYIDAAGTKRWTTEVHATNVLFLGVRGRTDDGTEPSSTLNCTDGEIPF